MLQAPIYGILLLTQPSLGLASSSSLYLGTFASASEPIYFRRASSQLNKVITKTAYFARSSLLFILYMIDFLEKKKTPMPTLILDTSSDYSLLALAENDTLIAEYPLPVGQQSLTLLPSIDGFLKCHHLKTSDLTSIAIGIGPGAFTGTRIGVTIAKTLSYAHNIPLLPFCSLMALPPKPGAFISVFDAKGGHIYILPGHHTSSGTTYSEPALSTTSDLPQNTALLSPHSTTLITKDLQWHSVQPNAAHLASLLSTLTPTHHIEVLYLRTP